MEKVVLVLNVDRISKNRERSRNRLVKKEFESGSSICRTIDPADWAIQVVDKLLLPKSNVSNGCRPQFHLAPRTFQQIASPFRGFSSSCRSFRQS